MLLSPGPDFGDLSTRSRGATTAPAIRHRRSKCGSSSLRRSQPSIAAWTPALLRPLQLWRKGGLPSLPEAPPPALRHKLARFLIEVALSAKKSASIIGHECRAPQRSPCREGNAGATWPAVIRTAINCLVAIPTQALLAILLPEGKQHATQPNCGLHCANDSASAA